MGTWGPGNFENDTAAEYLINLCGPLISQIEQTATDPELMQPDEPDSEVMLANVEILAVLAENIGRFEESEISAFVFPFPYPDPKKIEQWKRDYLKEWDAHIDELSPDADYKQLRRDIIVRTFDRLLRGSKEGPPTLPGE